QVNLVNPRGGDRRIAVTRLIVMDAVAGDSPETIVVSRPRRYGRVLTSLGALREVKARIDGAKVGGLTTLKDEAGLVVGRMLPAKTDRVGAGGERREVGRSANVGEG